MLSRITRTRQLSLCGFQRRFFLTHNNHCRTITRKPHQYDFIDFAGLSNYTYDIRVDENGKYFRVYDELQQTGKIKNNETEYSDPDGNLFYVTELAQQFKRELKSIHIPYIMYKNPYLVDRGYFNCHPAPYELFEGNINGVHIVKEPLFLFYRIPINNGLIMAAQLTVPKDSVVVIDWKHPTLYIGKFRASRVDLTYRVLDYSSKSGNYDGIWFNEFNSFQMPSFKTLDINDPDTGISGYFDLNTLLQSEKKCKSDTNKSS